MRVLNIVDNIAIASGVSSVVMNFFRNIPREDIQFDFLVCYRTEPSYEEEIRKAGGEITYIGNPLRPQTLFSAMRNAKRFFRTKGRLYDAVHLQSPTIAEFTLKYAKKYGVPVRIIHSQSTMTSMNPLKAWVNQWLMGRIWAYSTDYWACSREAAEFLYGKDCLKRHHVEIVNNAIDRRRFVFSPEMRVELRRKWGLEEKKVICHVSNFSPIKNVGFLVDVIAQTKNDVYFVFIGDGPTRTAVESAIDERGLADRCLFLGRRSDVGTLLSMVDAVVLPSIKEGLPITILEAQASGIPSLITDSITREVVVGEVKFLPLECEKWVEAINGVAVKSDQQRNIDADRFVGSRFDLESEAKRITSLYQQTRCKERA